MKKIIACLFMALSITTHAQLITVADNAIERQKPVNWGFSVCPTATTYWMQMPQNYSEPLKSAPGMGVDLGAYLDYNLSQLWVMQFVYQYSVSRIHLLNGPVDDVIMPHGINLSIRFELRLPLRDWRLLINAGPYSQFTLGCNTFGPSNLENPFTHQINDKGDMAMTDFHSGISGTIGLESPKGWQLMMATRLCLTNLLNFDAEDAYVLPQSIGLSFGKRF